MKLCCYISINLICHRIWSHSLKLCARCVCTSTGSSEISDCFRWWWQAIFNYNLQIIFWTLNKFMFNKTATTFCAQEIKAPPWFFQFCGDVCDIYTFQTVHMTFHLLQKLQILQPLREIQILLHFKFNYVVVIMFTHRWPLYRWVWIIWPQISMFVTIKHLMHSNTNFLTWGNYIHMVKCVAIQ